VGETPARGIALHVFHEVREFLAIIMLALYTEILGLAEMSDG
jgi:hypothetical protein